VTGWATLIGWSDLAATTVVAGAVIFAALIAPTSRAGRRAASAAAVLLATTFAIELVTTAIRLQSLAQVDRVTLVIDLLNTHWGRLWMLRVGGLLILIRARAPSRRFAAFAALWLLARSFQGHAGAHGSVSALIDWVHLLAAVTWLGGLLQYVLLPRSTSPAVASRLRAVSTWSLLALVPAGVYGALQHVASYDALVTSAYGRVLAAKLILAATLVGLGAAAHFRYVPALWRAQPAAERGLHRIVTLECCIGIVVLLMTALLGVLPLPHGPLP
jgi:putative copper export protein